MFMPCLALTECPRNRQLGFAIMPFARTRRPIHQPDKTPEYSRRPTVLDVDPDVAPLGDLA